MRWHTEPGAVLRELGSVGRRRRQRSVVVGIEGFMNCGKTTLASLLAERPDAVHLELDRFVFLHGDRAAYCTRLRRPAIVRELRKAIARGRNVVIDGICLRLALGSDASHIDRYVYVKRVSPAGLWHDEFHLQDFEGPAIPEHLKEEVTLSDFRYHSRFLPHKRADIGFIRVEGND